MRVLMTDGSGLTARQSANRLWAAGHTVGALSPDPFCLCRFTRHVAGVHRVPRFGTDPVGWLTAALHVYRSGGFDLLFPTQEQVAVLAASPDRLAAAGVVTAVPPFAALAAVQDKVSAFGTLDRLGIPQPPSALGPDGWDRFPAYVKQPIGTASGGVRRVDSVAALEAAAAGGGPVLVQAAATGPLAMCQSVFDRGGLVAFHANLRTREGPNGGASHKRGIALPAAREVMDRLGRGLGWHGALSCDVVLTDQGPVVIDVNPRLVEPENAWRSGVDLVGTLVDVARGTVPPPQADAAEGAATHQLLLAVLGAAQQGRRRRGVLAELWGAWWRTGAYAGSVEELTPTGGDGWAGLPVALAAAATLVRPSAWSAFTSGSVSAYALAPEGWDRVLAAAGRAAGTSPPR